MSAPTSVAETSILIGVPWTKILLLGKPMVRVRPSFVASVVDRLRGKPFRQCRVLIVSIVVAQQEGALLQDV